MTEVIIRTARTEDLDRITEIESVCFPASEAATRESIRERIAAFSDSFLVAESGGKIIGFVNGCVTNSPVICDDLYHSTRRHIPDGANQTIFGLDVIPECQRRGIAAQLMNHFIKIAGDAGRKSVILTCKARMVHYYESFGFVNNGISESTHGGAEWFDMTLVL